MTNLADTQNVVDDRTTRTKTEHAVLQARYDMLEEQLRDVCCVVIIVVLLNHIIFFWSHLVGVSVRRTFIGRAKTASRVVGTCRTRSHSTE